MPNVREIQVEQRKLLIKYLRLQEKFPGVLAIEELVKEMEAEMYEEDVVWVKAKLYGEPKNS